MNNNCKFLLLLILSGLLFSARSQDSVNDKSFFQFGADINSRYIYRGMNMGQTPSIQPYLFFDYKGFEIGTFGAFGTNSNYYKVNTYLSYSAMNLTFMLLDIFVTDELKTEYNYFDYSRSSTAHSIEPSIEYTGSDNFPVRLLAATIIYGDDLDAAGDMYYSTYFEVGKYGLLGDLKYDVFIALTPWEGFYGDKFGVVNMGAKFKRDIEISSKYMFSLSSSIILNPQKENLYLVFGVSL